jgi:hypothetical protein
MVSAKVSLESYEQRMQMLEVLTGVVIPPEAQPQWTREMFRAVVQASMEKQN